MRQCYTLKKKKKKKGTDLKAYQINACYATVLYFKKKKKKGETISRTKRFVGSNLRSDF